MNQLTQLKNVIVQKKVVLWDFDGCLCDSEPIHYRAYAKAFEKYGHTINKDEYYNTFTHTGGGIAQEIKNHGVVCDADDIRLKKAEYYLELIKSGEAKVFPEIAQIVSCLSDLKIKSVVASNSLAVEIKEILSQQQPRVDIAHVFGLEEGLRKKPFPDIFNYALSALGISPQDALVIEDSERGLLAAEAAHCDALWINTYITEKFITTAPHLAKITHAEFLKMLTSL